MSERKPGFNKGDKSSKGQFKKATPAKKATPTASIEIKSPMVNRNPVVTQTDVSKLKNITVFNMLPIETSQFPRGMDPDYGRTLYRDVAKSMLEWPEGGLTFWAEAENMIYHPHDVSDLWMKVNNLKIYESKDIGWLVFERGERLGDLTGYLVDYLEEAYNWAYDDLMEYIGGYSYVTDEYGMRGTWVKQGAPIAKKNKVYSSPRALREEKNMKRLKKF